MPSKKNLEALIAPTKPKGGHVHGAAFGKAPRILTLDIETSPNVVYAWGLWDQNIAVSQVIAPTRMLCFAAKWSDSNKVEFYSEFHDGRLHMVQRAWELLNEADIVVSYNGPAFDIKHLQREFVTNGMTPPSPFKNIDLLKTSRSQFKFPSNKLDYVSQALEVGRKLKHTGQDLWNDVLAGNAKAWDLMRKYNIQDVRLTEDLFKRLGPWIKGMPNLSLWLGKFACHKCGSEKLSLAGWVRTNATTNPRLLCETCGAWNKQVTVRGQQEVRPL